MLVRSLFFYFLLYLWTIFLGIIFLPFLFLPNNYLKKPINFWIKGILLFLKQICSISYEFRNIENIPNEPVIIASKHQSAFETLALFYYFKKSLFIHKKELLYIPIFGLYLKKCNMIAINRKQGTSSMRKMLKEVKNKISNGYSIIIFPEGTRKKPNENTNYKSGITGIYNECKCNVLPVALNSGCFWQKGKITKNPGKIIIKFLEVIPSGLEKSNFLKILEKKIEKESAKIN
ncbi:MAG: hypothetical protein CFH19_00008 [Alphaproteobacteria bacterium MarineAlpha5_Bin9]|nr:MAG: hypothetical protein CFH19_00008 [Alphaproteobacteria bacterium MarineAlpha5_Bin9]|tara:strand:+ start:7716 stop:8414 length:699 start_codon:yes stop_codon:yes gene_type:complete